jgi:SAM-dependent MidA family methyltransferase
MNQLEKIIIDKIKKEGPLSFETFMDMSLYYPGLGYYTSPQLKIGRKGDFYTSPHLHKVFGAMIGKQFEEMWNIMGKPDKFYAVEIGAGAGHLCKDILEYCKTREIMNALHMVIVELNPSVIENQKNLLFVFSDRVKWISSIQELQDMRGCIFSNELLDAFPIHLIIMQGEPREICVDYMDSNLIEKYHEVQNNEILSYLKMFSPALPQGYRTEINLRLKDWLKQISNVLSEGFLFTVDYGYTAQEYYDADRFNGTLLCYYKHTVHENPYEKIGLQDMTAHVNFSSLKTWGEDTGLKTIGYCPQGTFLVALGIDELITDLYAHSPDYASEILKIKGLILPHGMGESHKVMVQYKGKGIPEIRGFSLRNQRGSL